MMRRCLLFPLSKFQFLMLAIPWFIIIATYSFPPSLVALLSGVTQAKYGHIDILGIVRWVFSIFPPIIACMPWIEVEMGPWSKFTIPRYQHLRKWFAEKVIALSLYNLFYVSIPVFVFLPNLKNEDGTILLYTILLFFLNTVMTTYICTAVRIITRKLSGTILAFMIVCISGMLGLAFPNYAVFMLGSYGMSVNTTMFEGGTIPSNLAPLVLLGATLLSILFSYHYVKYNNPGAFPL